MTFRIKNSINNSCRFLKLGITFSFIMFIIIFSSKVYAAEQYSGNIIPAMTSATSPTPFAVTATDYYGSYYPFQAFDHDINTKWYIYSSPYLANDLNLDLGTQRNVSKIKLTSFNVSGSSQSGSMKDWKLYGSNDGNSYILITNGTQSDTIWPSQNMEQSYEFINNDSYRFYKLQIINSYSQDSGYNIGISELEMYEKSNIISSPSNLTAITSNKNIKLNWDAVEGAIGYSVKRSTTSGGPYITIASSVTEATYTDTSVSNDTTYYYVVSALNGTFESANSNEVSATPRSLDVTLTVEAIDKSKIGDEITVNIVIHNANTICAEDLKINYNTDLLEYVGYVNASGMKVYKDIVISTGLNRYITASLGKDNAANGDKILLKLVFRAKKAGEAKVDIVNGRIADNATLEMDVLDENCGEKTILIEGIKDVNRTGEFTLLDLGIDAYYNGNLASETDISKYDADVDASTKIDDGDLNLIVIEMLKNTMYPANY